MSKKYRFVTRVQSKNIHDAQNNIVLTMTFDLKAETWNEALTQVTYLLEDNPNVVNWEYVRGGEDVG